MLDLFDETLAKIIGQGFLGVLPFVVNRFAMMLIALVLILSPLIALAQPVPCLDPKTRDAVRQTMVEGLNEAFQLQITRLFESWMKDSVHQPDRAAAGLNQAVEAYLFSREAALRWNPPGCK